MVTDEDGSQACWSLVSIPGYACIGKQLSLAGDRCTHTQPQFANGAHGSDTKAHDNNNANEQQPPVVAAKDE